MKTKSLIKIRDTVFSSTINTKLTFTPWPKSNQKKGTPLSKDLVIDIQPVVVPNLPESSGATYYPTVLPGEPGMPI